MYYSQICCNKYVGKKFATSSVAVRPARLLTLLRRRRRSPALHASLLSRSRLLHVLLRCWAWLLIQTPHGWVTRRVDSWHVLIAHATMHRAAALGVVELVRLVRRWRRVGTLLVRWAILW